MRVLFAVPPFVGHINPTLGLAAALEARGHSVAWVGHATAVAPRINGRTIFPLPEVADGDALDALFRRAQEARGLEIVRSRFEDIFFPLARAMRPGIEAAVEAFVPDVLVVDHQVFGGALAARRTGVRWATLATTSVPLLDPFGPYPKVKAWLDEQHTGLQREVGLERADDPELSPDLVIVTSVPELAGPSSPIGPRYAWCGPITGGRGPVDPFPWERLSNDRPRVLVSLGTVNAELGGPFFSAVRELPPDAHQRVVVGPAEVVGELQAPSFRVDRAPQLELLREIQAVVCHGGHNTVAEALAARVPVVVAPMKDDQPLVAQQVVNAGVGVRVHSGRRATAAALGEALRRVLTEPGFRERVEAVGAALEAGGGGETAARRVEALAGS